jgi:flavin-dependent dehydrogenase
LRNAARQGAEVIEGAVVRQVLFDGDRAVAAEWTRRGEIAIQTARFDVVIDASGRNGVLASGHFDMRRQHEVFQNVAIWSYWDGARLLPGSPEGAINVVSTPDGWWWHIPLGDGRYSVGKVMHKRRFLQARGEHDSLEALYAAELRRSEAMLEVTRGARQAAPVKVEQDYSYVADRFCGPGYMLIGDAACFLDPLLSTGVHLAQYSGMIAAAAIVSSARGDVTETEGWSFFEYVYRRAYTRLLVLVSRMYQTYKGKDDYFWSTQKLVHASTHHHEPIRNFTDISTGLTDLHEAVDTDVRVLNSALMEAAQAEQDAKAAEVGASHLLSLDLSAFWRPWRSLEGADTTMAEIRLVTQPTLGLSKNGMARESHS